ncbi:DUF1501 domain-containing protein [Lignipirellula cremea]|uniref:Sulfatase n=1 Tax=Lignipirellula cremea TaxID=2528010 RepID=A0A518DUQ1_9BACT|nr:DUF1501 domain-containing protein [Lignipirellula cremea]QDU95565.1 hypothetical protein Pla8534_33810 [Lignipirellula cremea]
MTKLPPFDRRQFLAASSLAGGATLLGANGLPALSAADHPQPEALADSCIFIWLGGGACHLDTWDPKRKSTGKTDPGSYYDAIDTAIPGVQVCAPLKRMANLMDRTAVLRTINHDVINEHAAATNRVHTGRPPTGTTIYPSIGSIVSHQLGPRGDGVPAYVVMGYPSASRGPGFLGARHSYVYLTDTELGPAGLQPRPEVTAARMARRQRMLSTLREDFLARNSGPGPVDDYIAASQEGDRLAGPKFMSVFDLKSEPESLREEFGGEFGQRCLLARRLVESGVRFVEVSFNLNFINGTGWDTHNAGQLNQHLLIDQLDQALASLILDLEKRNRLDKTLIVVATEFGRPPEFDGGGGRGHQPQAFSVLLAGGGLKTGQAVGTTDELAKKIVDRPISVPDLHATIHRTLGINHTTELYDGDRPVPITDRGEPVAELFS